MAAYHLRSRSLFLALAGLFLLSLACQTVTGGPPASAEPPSPLPPTPTVPPEPQLSATALPPTPVPTEALPDAPPPSPEGEALAYPGEVYELRDPPEPFGLGTQVKDRLQALGYEICTEAYGANSPFYTAQTAYAVRHFQEVNGLEASGAVDEATWNALFAPNALPAPAWQAETLSFAQSFPGSGATELGAAANGWLWLSARGFGMADAFDPASPDLYAGIYAILGSEEEGYANLLGLASDGETLWAAFQGDESAGLQAYDPSLASPVEGMLNPLWAQSVPFDSFYIRGLSYGGGRVWAAVEAMGGMHLVPIDPQAQAALPYIEFPFETFPNAPAYDEGLQTLWVPVQGVNGDNSLLAVDPDTGPTGEILGVCGFQAAYAGGRLWVAQTNRLLGVDTASRQVVAVVPLSSPDLFILALIPDGDNLWVVTVDGMVQQVVTR